MDAHEMVRGRETAILDAIGVTEWRKTTGSNHARCPFPDHDDKNPSWRWDKSINKWTCTCVNGVWRDVYDAVERMKGLGKREAFFLVRELVEAPLPTALTVSSPSCKEVPESRVKEPHALAPRWPEKPDVFHQSKWGRAGKISCYTIGGRVYEARVRYDGPAVKDAGQSKVVLPWYWTGKRWVCGAAPAPRPAYRLEDIVQDVSVPILWVEGEPAVDGAEKLFPQFVATTTSGGCKQHEQTDYSSFVGRRVVIWQDNDEPGAAYAQAVAAHLCAVGAAEVRIVDVPAAWPKGWDLGDDPPVGISQELLRAMVDGAKVWEVPAEPTSREGFTIDIPDEVKAQVEEEIGNEILLNKDKEPKKCAHNIRVYLKRLGVRITYNEHACEYEVQGPKGSAVRLDDDGLADLSLAIEKEGGVANFPKDYVDRVIMAEGRKRRFHPVRDYLNSLKWDGSKRLDTWLIRYMGAKDDTGGVVRAIGRLMLIAAVRRVRNPGCKYDSLVVLEGAQGTGKSRAVQALCPDKKLFSDCISLHMDPKVVIELTSGKWIVEIGELAGMKKGEVESVKAMLSRQVDESRLAWGKISAKRPREWIMVGTTNESNYLIDETGNRRFLPVRCGEIDVAGIVRDRDQLWAEAAAHEAQGEDVEPLYLPDHVQASLIKEQKEREVTDDSIQFISAWIDINYPEGCHTYKDDRLTISDVGISALGLTRCTVDTYQQGRIRKCLRQLGWEKTMRANGKNYWRRTSALGAALWEG